MACVHKHELMHVARVPETMKGKFFALMLRFGTNHTSSRNRSKPPFLNYIKPYMEYFKEETKKILRENLRFARNSESKREFSQNILKSILF